MCVLRCSEEAFKGTSPPLTDIINVSLSAVVVKCMGPAYGISRSPCERAALWTGAGHGPVDAPGWSLTWKSDPTEGWTQGRRTHARRWIYPLSFILIYNNQLQMYYWQILSSRMTEAPQPSVTATMKEEIPSEPTFKAVMEDEKSSEEPTHEWVSWAGFLTSELCRPLVLFKV